MSKQGELSNIMAVVVYIMRATILSDAESNIPEPLGSFLEFQIF